MVMLCHSLCRVIVKAECHPMPIFFPAKSNQVMGNLIAQTGLISECKELCDYFHPTIDIDELHKIFQAFLTGRKIAEKHVG